MSMDYNEIINPLSKKGLTFHRVVIINVVLVLVFSIFWLRRDYILNFYNESSLSILSIFLKIIIVVSILLNIFSAIAVYLAKDKYISFQKMMTINIFVIYLFAMFLLWRDWVNYYQFRNILFNDSRLIALLIGKGGMLLVGVLINIYYAFSKQFVERYALTFRKLIIINTGLLATIAVLNGFINLVIQQQRGNDDLITLIPVIALFILNSLYIRNINYISESDFSFRRLIIVNVIALLVMLLFSTFNSSLDARDWGIAPDWILLSYTISMVLIVSSIIFNALFARNDSDDDSYNKITFDIFVIINISLLMLLVLFWIHRSWQPLAFITGRHFNLTLYAIIAAIMIIGALILNLYYVFKNHLKK